MPSGLCLLPSVIDNSHLKTEPELHSALSLIVEITTFIQDERAKLVATPMLGEMINDIEWTDQPYPEISDLVRHLSILLLSPGLSIIISVESTNESEPHPLPIGVRPSPLSSIWSEEVGNLFFLHEKSKSQNEPPFIGIPCENAFFGNEISKYDSHSTSNRFPIVGPDSVTSLGDLYEWDAPIDYIHRPIYFSDVMRNYRAIGATSIRNPSSGSHYQVEFPASRPWPLDSNHDPCVESYLRELIDITNLPLIVIKYALLNGKLPPKRLRL